MKVNRTRILLLMMLLFSCTQLKAQSELKEPTQFTPWYVGLSGGVPFGVSTFSAFGAEKTRAGYNFGALTGYRINHLFSAEFSAMFGRIGLGSSNCCTDYWLGVDGERYLSPVAGMRGNYYRNLYSSVFIQQFGLHLNVDILQLIKRNDNTRWSALISPSIYGVGTSATIKNVEDKSQLMKPGGQFNFGIGGNIGVGYSLTNNLGIRLSSGLNCITGRNYDGIPGGDHSGNFVWNNNITLTWRLGKGKRMKSSQQQERPVEIVPIIEKQLPKEVKPVEQPIQAKVEEQVVTQVKAEEQKVEEQAIVQTKVEDQIAVEPKVEKQQETVKAQPAAQPATKIVFPIIYYQFNDIEVRVSQQKKLLQIFNILKNNPKMCITAAGYGDNVGKKAANDSVSKLRAEGVKYRLVKLGINSSRITVVGAGKDANNKSNARRVEVKQTKGKK